MRTDITAQLADYRGVFTWSATSAYLEGTLTAIPAITIPLYIKDHPVPMRTPRVTQIGTIPTIDPSSGKDISTQAVFWGAPDLLTLAISGWMITPIVSSKFYPTTDGTKTGTSLQALFGNISYPEVITGFLEGRFNQTVGGAWQRRDPDFYTSPHGNVYPNPSIYTWESDYTTNSKRQSFSTTMYLEK